ncbi:MAG: hypothetical protein ACR2PH_05550 [Desulfobulbia bacterium]
MTNTCHKSYKGNDELINSIIELYEDHPTGALLHIILDDYNTEDQDLVFCYNEIKERINSLNKQMNCLEELMKISTYWRLNIIELARKKMLEGGA